MPTTRPMVVTDATRHLAVLWRGTATFSVRRIHHGNLTGDAILEEVDAFTSYGGDGEDGQDPTPGEAYAAACRWLDAPAL